MSTINNQKLFFLVFLLLYTGLSSCEEEPIEETVVLTEDVLYVSGERAIFTGRFLSTGSFKLEDHGFVIDTDESFPSPITLSLGERTKPGLFFGETDQLVNQSKYFCKSFIKQSGTQVFGNVVPFSTLGPILNSYEPGVAFAGQNLEILGGNFTVDTEVYFGDEKASIEELTLESKIKVRIPPIGNDFIVPIKVVVQGDTLSFDQPFEYVIGKWTLEAEFINENAYTGSVFFIDGDQLIFGLGLENNAFHTQLWSMDLIQLSWSPIDYNGIGVYQGFYAPSVFGSGTSRFPQFPGDPGRFSNQFWSYDEGASSFEGEAPFKIIESIGFSFDQEIFVMGGENPDGTPNRVIHKFSTANGQWKVIGEAPVAISVEYPHFQYEDGFYVIDGDNLLRKYSVTENNWSVVSTFPAALLFNGVAGVIRDKAYIGVFEGISPIWEYDLSSGVWNRKNNFPGDFLESNAAYWTYNDKLYLMKNGQKSNSPMEIWSLAPNDF